MGPRLRRMLAIGAASAAAGALVLLALAHTPPVRARVLAWAIGLLEARAGLRLQASTLGYNLLTGRVALADVRLAATGHEARPFFTAARVEVNLPLAVYAGRFSLDDLVIDGGRVDLLTDAGGASNLPAGADAPPPDSPSTLAINGLRLRGLDLVYDNRAADVRVVATGISAELAHRSIRVFDGITGPLVVAGGVDLQAGSRTLRVAPIESRLAFDGSAVSLQSLPISTTLGDLAVSGRVTRVLDDPAFELTFEGHADAGAAARWTAAPLAVDGRVDLAGSLAGPAASPDVVLRVEAGELTIEAEQGLRVSGELLLNGGAIEANRLRIEPESGGTIEATFKLPLADESPEVNARWRDLDARVLMRVTGLDVRPIGTRLDGTARASGGPAPALALETEATALTSAGLTPLAGRAAVQFGPHRWQAAYNLRTTGVHASGTAGGRANPADVRSSTLEGPARVVIDSLAAADQGLTPLGVRLPAALRDISGAIAIEIGLAGTIAAAAARASLNAPALDLPVLGVAALRAGIAADPSRIDITEMSLTADAVQAVGHAHLDVAANALDGRLTADIADIERLQEDVPAAWRASGTATLDARLAGAVDAPIVHLDLTSPRVSLAGESFEALRARGRLHVDGIDEVAVEFRQNEDGWLRASGRYGFDGRFTAGVDATGLSWTGTLLGGAESRVIFGGRFEGSGTVDEPFGTARAGFAVTGGVAADLVGQGTVDVALNGDHARLNVLIPSLGAFATGHLELAAPYAYRGSAVLGRVDLAALAPLAALEPQSLTGRLVLTAAAHGAVQGDEPLRVEAHLRELSAAVGGVPLALASPATVTWTPGDLEVRAFEATFGGGTITASGAWAGRDDTVFAGRFRGELADLLAAARAAGLSPGLTASGRVDLDLYATGRPGDLIVMLELGGGRLEAGEVTATGVAASLDLTGETVALHNLRATIAAPNLTGALAARGRGTIPGFDLMRASGEVVFDEAAFDAAGVEVRQARPSVFSLADGVVTATDVTWEAAGSTLALGGTVDLEPEAPALDLHVAGTAVLAVLSAFVPAVAFDGTAAVDVRVGGTTAVPDLAGRIDLNAAAISVTSPRLVIAGVEGPIVLAGSRIELRGLTGSANGGRLVVDGGVVLVGPDVGAGEIVIQAEGVAVEYPDGLRSEVDALLTYRLGNGAPLLSGDVRVQRGAFTRPISLAALAGGGRAAPAVSGGASALDDLRLDVAVTTIEDLRVDNNYGRFEGGAQLRIVGTAGQPGVSGRATLRDGGTIFAAGRTFTLTRGTVSFTNLSRVEPELDIQAETRLPGMGTVTLTLQGTPDRFSFDLASDQDASQEEIAMALFGGGVSSENALALLSSDLLGVAGRQIGLDQLRLDRGGVVRDEFREDATATSQDLETPVARLTLSKRLSDNVEFTLSQNLAQDGRATFIVSYYPIPNLEVRAISRDDSSTGVGVRHQVTFGNGRRPARARARTGQRVAGVRFEGDPAPLTAAELRGRLRLSDGDRFEYFDWQRDLDALTAAYVERGYFEARVRGRREDRPDGGVDVIYSVVPGPQTSVAVDGVRVSGEDLREIERAWQRTVFDRFLIQDAEARLRRSLVAAGFVDASVSGRMEAGPGTKTLRLSVEPGRPARRRTIRFTGAAALGAGQLQAAVERAGLAVDGWVDRAAIERVLVEFYRSEGFLSTTVVVQAPAIEQDVAVLPVEIVEGRRAEVGRVAIEGVGDARQEAVSAEWRLAPGTAYTRRAVDAARDRVERRYRQLGFNGVTVSVEVEPDGNGEVVDVRLRVSEGPRQVLREVVTSGATRTRDGVVSRALRLPVGEPVDLGEWALARKRLFDTNVFRSVDIQAEPLGDPVDGVQPVRARVTVEEYPHWRLRYGFQVDRERIDDGVDGRFDLSPGAIGEIRNQNLLGRALTGGVATRVSRDFQRLNLFGQAPAFFGLPLRSSLFAFVSRQNLRADGEVFAVSDVSGISAEQRWRRRRGLEFTYAYRFETNHTYDPAPFPGDPFPLDATFTVGRLTGAFLFDRRDDPVSATRGTFSSVSVEQAATWLGGDDTFGKLLSQQLSFLRVGPLVVASRVVAGTSFGGELSLFERFYAGGGTSVRGYAENGLGPRDPFGAPRGGLAMLVVNQELRFPLLDRVRGVVFLDAGNVFDRAAAVGVGGLKVGYGAGLRVGSPIGILRLDFGIPGSTLPDSRRAANELRSGRWYFGIGHVF